MRILFLSPWFPFPPDNGSKIRIYHLLRALGRQHDTTLLSFAGDGESPAPECIPEFCALAGLAARPVFRPDGWRARLAYLHPWPRSLVDTYSPQMAHMVEHMAGPGRFDVMIASELGMSPYLARANPAQIAGIIDEVQTAAIRDQYARAQTRPARLRAGLTWLKTRAYVRRSLRRARACTVASERERSYIKEIDPAYARVAVIPNGVDTTRLSMAAVERDEDVLIFNGALTYSANLDAMQYFTAEVWPLVKAAQPGVRLRITGRTDGVADGPWATDARVELTGYLADIHAAVARASVCVVPLRVGGGTRLKILEAMALGTPVVATSKGAEGLAVKHEEHLLIADEPAEFAASVVRLLRDDALRRRLALNARRLVEREYDWNQIGRLFSAFVAESAEDRRAG